MPLGPEAVLLGYLALEEVDLGAGRGHRLEAVALHDRARDLEGVPRVVGEDGVEDRAVPALGLRAEEGGYPLPGLDAIDEARGKVA